jgi:hypothetical protein
VEGRVLFCDELISGCFPIPTEPELGSTHGHDLPAQVWAVWVFDGWADDLNGGAHIPPAAGKVVNDDSQISMLATHSFLLFSSIAELAGAAIWNKSPQPVMWASHKKTRHEAG